MAFLLPSCLLMCAMMHTLEELRSTSMQLSPAFTSTLDTSHASRQSMTEVECLVQVQWALPAL